MAIAMIRNYYYVFICLYVCVIAVDDKSSAAADPTTIVIAMVLIHYQTELCARLAALMMTTILSDWQPIWRCLFDDLSSGLIDLDWTGLDWT